MQQRNKTRSRLALWVLAGAVGAGVPLATPTAVWAQDVKEVEESRVPAPVAQAARANYLDARDVVYRKTTEGRELYLVNFTIPQNVRMQVRIAPDGRVVDGPELAPSQAENAPKRDDRQRIAAEWVSRVRTNATAADRPRTIPPEPGVAPVPSITPGVPTTPGGVAAPPARPVTTDVRANELPGDVLRSLDRFTTGGRDVQYSRQRVEDTTRYQAVYTDRDGARREVVVADNGSLIAGPMVIAENVTDQMLAADKPDEFQLATGTRIEPRDVPVGPARTFDQYTQRAQDVRYRRDTYANGNVAYTAHWVDPVTARRYFMTVGENASVVTAPRLSTYQPPALAGGRDIPRGRDLPGRDAPRDRDMANRDRPQDRDEQVARRGADNAVRWNDLPERVQRGLEATRQDRNAEYFRQNQNGFISYGSLFKDREGREMWMRVAENGDKIAGPVLASTGRGVNDNDRDARPAAGGRLTDEQMRRDRVNFDTLPKDVQQRILRETQGGRDYSNMRHEIGGRTYYHTTYTNDRGQQRELWLSDRGEPVADPRSR